ncbi:unnamed protein product, partial [marine sediment metagenome]
MTGQDSHDGLVTPSHSSGNAAYAHPPAMEMQD